MEETYKFLKERTKVNFVATINGDKPSNRPFGDPFMFEDKIYVSFKWNSRTAFYFRKEQDKT